jgi:threonine/homoserine/homoserine lactone efflux protein
MINLLEAIRLGVGYGFLISALAIGPSFFMVLQTSIQRGWKMAIALELGIIISDVVCIFFAYLGASNLLAAIQGNQYTYPSAGAVLIVYGLLKFIRDKKPVKAVKTINAQGAFTLFFRGFFINIINPGLLLYWFTIVGLGFETLKSEHLSEKELLYANILFNTTILAVVFAIDLLKIFFAQKLRNVLQNHILEKIDQVVSFIFIGIGLFFVFKNFI